MTIPRDSYFKPESIQQLRAHFEAEWMRTPYLQPPRTVRWWHGNMVWEEQELAEPEPGCSFTHLCYWLAQRVELNRQERSALDTLRAKGA